MRWSIKSPFSKTSPYELFASNLYGALVLDGGPSGGSESRLDVAALKIPVSKLSRFAEKRLVMLEAFLLISTHMAVTKANEAHRLGLSAHPLAKEMENLVRVKWLSRGIDISDSFDVSEMCFDELEEFQERPFRWGRKWLDEFYENDDGSGEHYIMWTDQCLKEFSVMQQVIGQNI